MITKSTTFWMNSPYMIFALPIVTGLTMPPFAAALIGLTVHLAAYAAEIVRAGVESVRPGQTRASLALGMSRVQILRRIVLPQAIVRMLPAFGSLFSITIKTSYLFRIPSRGSQSSMTNESTTSLVTGEMN